MDLSLNSILRGVSLPKLNYLEHEISPTLKSLKHYSNLESTTPVMKKLFDISNKETIIFENNFIIENITFKQDDTIKGNCFLTLKNGDSVESYMKVTHLVDPVRYLQKKYNDENFEIKINDPCNQAYVETLASYLVGKLRKEDISPHFNLFYGAFKSIANKYSYNISDEVETYRKYRWFWDSIENSDISIDVETEDEVLAAEVMSEIMNKPDFCIESSSEVIEELIPVNDEDESQSIQTLDTASLKTEKEDDDENNETEENDDDDDDDDDEEECNVFMNLKKFPVMMIFTEKNVSTMDDLLDNYDEVGAKIDTEEWEERWTAWLFQIIASLCVLQTLFKFTHNDLHTNNIVWEKTEKQFLYYKTFDNKIFKVPTYGKIFKLIDFGRSIFSYNDHIFISDDFYEGNDADTQYNFPPLNENEESKVVYPNFSFDLSRLSISLFESLFDEKPRDKLNAKILSKEDNRVVKETVSELYNMLWAWLIDDHGKNILFDENDEERFPDFQLYVHISAHCNNGVPKEQLKRKLFQKYLLKKETKLSKDIKVYPLYV
jgi:hypothetical protein